MIFGPLAKFIEEGQVLDSSGIFGVVVFEYILFVLFLEQDPSAPATVVCWWDIGFYNINTLPRLGFVPVELPVDAKGVPESWVQVVMFVVLTRSIKDYFECLGADSELVAEGFVDDVEDALLD